MSMGMNSAVAAISTHDKDAVTGPAAASPVAAAASPDANGAHMDDEDMPWHSGRDNPSDHYPHTTAEARDVTGTQGEQVLPYPVHLPTITEATSARISASQATNLSIGNPSSNNNITVPDNAPLSPTHPRLTNATLDAHARTEPTLMESKSHHSSGRMEKHAGNLSPTLSEARSEHQDALVACLTDEPYRKAVSTAAAAVGNVMAEINHKHMLVPSLPRGSIMGNDRSNSSIGYNRTNTRDRATAKAKAKAIGESNFVADNRGVAGQSSSAVGSPRLGGELADGGRRMSIGTAIQSGEGKQPYEELSQNAKDRRKALQAQIDNAPNMREAMLALVFEDGLHDGDVTRLDGRPWSWRRTKHMIWITMSDPGSSMTAWTISVLILVFIILSSLTFCLETMPEFAHPNATRILSDVEIVCIAIFTAEYVLKLITAPDMTAFVKAPLNIIDLIAIMPFYIILLFPESSGGQTRVLRVIRLIRVFRVLKLGTRFAKMEVVVTAVMESLDMLGMLLFLLTIAVVMFSSLMYYVEKGAGESHLQPINRDYSSIPETFWWCIVTLMTVGYGDAVPNTLWGRMIAACAMVASIIIMALPISVIGGNFTQQWTEYKDCMLKAKRTSHMWNKFQNLLVRLQTYDKVLKDVLHQTVILRSELDRDLRELLAMTKEARVQQDALAIDGRAPFVSKPMELSHMTSAIKERLRAARGKHKALKKMVRVFNAMSSDKHKLTEGSRDKLFEDIARSYNVLREFNICGLELADELQSIEHAHETLNANGNGSVNSAS